MRFIFIFIIFFSFAYSNINECRLDKKILYSVLLKEGLAKNIGYEYIISFNKDSDIKRVKKSKLKSYFVSGSTIDCKNPFLCEVILTKLNEAGIKNLDLGAFQINYSSHKLKNKKDYFDLEKSYIFACGYIEKMIKKYGYNWYAIGSYHSQTPYYNEKYRKDLIKKYDKVTLKLDSKLK